MRSTLLHVGFMVKEVTEQEIRNAQAALLHDKLSKYDRNMIDAVLTHFIHGRSTRWYQPIPPSHEQHSYDPRRVA